MVCTANDLQNWKDFPKGLRVLLLDGDITSASEIRTKLEAMDYIVSTFCDENEALSAISSSPESFHVAIVEVNTSSSPGSFKFLENAKDLPTIMTSNNHCLRTMMECIALGAVEFVSKPLSEEKLRNIWQHVVHNAFNSRTSVISESQKRIKESVESSLHFQTDSEEHEGNISINLEKVSGLSDNEHEQSAGSDKYPAPSTPQLKQGARLLDDADCQEQTNCSTEKESGDHDGESKYVETTTCGALNAEGTCQPIKPEVSLKMEEENFANDSKSENDVSSSHLHDIKDFSNIDGSTESPNKAGDSDSHQIKTNRKKMKVDWTPQLHKKFVKAVELLGIEQAIPSRILELMKVEGLTRHNVASHLQKYRMRKRQILPKEDRRWLQQRPIMAFPPYYPNNTLSPAPAYPIWGQPGSQPAGVHMWGPPSYPMWQPSESWHWTPLLTMHADAWGCPMLPHPPQDPHFSCSEKIPRPHNVNVGCSSSKSQNSLAYHPAEEVVNKAVKEAISKPWLPMPLGLKPPSTDIVLAELSKQGISAIPPRRKRSKCQPPPSPPDRKPLLPPT